MTATPLPHSPSRLPMRHFRSPDVTSAVAAYGGSVAMGTHCPRAARFAREVAMAGPAALREPAATRGAAAVAGPPASEGPGQAAGGGSLSGAEKEKLREKLALLRREYSETVSRLRRARRAERARSHGQCTAAEGGRQEERSPAGSRDKVSPCADKHETSQLQTKACSDLDTEKQTFKGVPVCSSDEAEVKLQASSQPSQQSWGVVRPAPEGKKSQSSSSLLKLRRRTKAVVLEEREAAPDVHRISTEEMVRNQMARTEELQSPVFRQSSLPKAEENIDRASRQVLKQREGSSCTPPEAALGVIRDVVDDSDLPGVPELFLSAPRDVWQPESPCALATSDHCERTGPRSENRDSVLLDTSEDRGKESSSVINQMNGETVCEDQGDLQRLLDLMSENEVLPADGDSTMTNESKSHQAETPNQRDAKSLNPFPTDLSVGSARELPGNQQPEVQSEPSWPEKVAAESTLNSCTVVEGLLFPVEYYVRTTRRMSSCQRKVDLDAVILSQLGRSKKGQRSKGKQKDANSDLPSQERAENNLETPFPFLAAENEPANSGSPHKSLPVSSGSNASLASASPSSVSSTRRDRRRSQQKQKGSRRPAFSPPVQQLSQELLESLELLTPGERSSLLSNEGQSEKENWEANLEKLSSDERRPPAAGALGAEGAGGTCATQLAGADPPGGSQGLGIRCRTLSEQLQNPLQSRDSLKPGNETLPNHIRDLEASAVVCQAGEQPMERVGNHHMEGACGAEQPLLIPVPPRRSLRSSTRQRATQASKDVSKRRLSFPAGSEGPASLGLPALDSNTCSSPFSFRSPQWLASKLGIRDFHLPDEEFGQLKLEKLDSSPVNELEVFVPSVVGDSVASGDRQEAQMNPELKTPTSNLVSPLKHGLPRLPPTEGPTCRKELSTHELLFTPMGTVLPGAPTQSETQISSSIFPVLGATPAVLPSAQAELFPSAPSAPPLQVSPSSSRGASAQVVGDGECKDSTLLLPLDSCAVGSAGREEERGTTFPSEAERGPDDKPGEVVALEKDQQSEGEQQRSCRASPGQRKAEAEQLAAELHHGPAEESLQLVSKLKDSSSSCAVDVSTTWWEAAGCRELCVVTACENCVSLWKPLASDCWGKVHTWHLGEVPLIQIVPLPDTCNVVCVALGELEIGEIRLLLYSSENDSFKQSVVKTGTIKAVLGLKDRRLVSSSRTVQEQQVEIVSLSETGRSTDGQTLMPPEETVLAFAEVEGIREALVGTTAVNSIVVWNLKTGQLLKKMHIGYSYPASICHRAYSDSGLLFVVLSHPHAKESESCGNPAFRLLAFNPTTARSRGVMSSSLPPGHTGRYLEGDVKEALAAAVLTSGAIMVWDLLQGQCTALLPPGPAGNWALARWATTGACLLAGQQDGTVCLYQYRQPQLWVA
ncbi:partner and localizer of BRCA2 [Indicator indicator]|uniref:partner and localizer of BRCA2 n=1 Tax=Indicator indicator TaxID=1002788 RepID=UPI0023DE6EEF|nr:partner and localizer of BRCA2 [Indicator indicator]